MHVCGTGYQLSSFTFTEPLHGNMFTTQKAYSHWSHYYTCSNTQFSRSYYHRNLPWFNFYYFYLLPIIFFFMGRHCVKYNHNDAEIWVKLVFWQNVDKMLQFCSYLSTIMVTTKLFIKQSKKRPTLKKRYRQKAVTLMNSGYLEHMFWRKMANDKKSFYSIQTTFTLVVRILDEIRLYRQFQTVSLHGRSWNGRDPKFLE